MANLITSLRVVLTLFGCQLLIYKTDQSLLITIVTLLIFISDYFDGIVARHLNITSKAGMIFDVATDLFYMCSMSIILYDRGIISKYFIGCILVEFVVFIITSRLLKKGQTVIVSDNWGRKLAAIYYVYPYISYIAYMETNEIYVYVRYMGTLIIALMTIICIINRLYMVKNVYDRNLRTVIKGVNSLNR